MLLALELENFKGVAARTRIDLAPATLLFGANNAGKSTILQALLYALEVLERSQADIDRTELGGEIVDLGGFARLVHRHQIDRTLAVRIELDGIGTVNAFERDLDDFPFPNLEDELDAVWIELRARWLEGAPRVTEMQVGTTGTANPAICLKLDRAPREGDPIRVAIDLEHPIFQVDEEGHHLLLETVRVRPETGLGELTLSRGTRPGAVPSLEDPLRLVLDYELPTDIRATLTTLLEMLVVGPARKLRQMLWDAIYIGPLRAMPPRSFLYERSARTTRWADGLAAWDALLADRGPLTDATNAWLRRLGAGCTLLRQSLVDPGASAELISGESGDAAVHRLLLEVGAGTTVLPCEVGAGISQVIPVVVAALEGQRRRLVMIEQPELHVHPGLQVGLGDLFIEASRERQLLIETHSENLVLRLLRRIRETGENELPEGAPAFTPDRLSILYVEAGEAGMQVRRLRVDPTGEFLDRWPRGFFEERAGELF